MPSVLRKMERICNVVFQGGAHGNFLRYYIDKFSKLTPNIDQLPFTDNGTSHNEIQYSGMVDRYHPYKQPPYFRNTDEPHVLITIDQQDILFLQRIVNMRAGDQKIDLNNDTIKLSKSYIENFDIEHTFKKLYGKDVNENTEIPKFIFRDFLKLAFLDPSKDGFIKRDNEYRKHMPDNTFLFPVSAFWNEDKFKTIIQEMSDKHNLKIEQSTESHEIYQKFIQNISQYRTIDRCDKIIKSLKDGTNTYTTDLDTVEQAYISAWIEKNHDFVSVPLCDYFFTTTKEINNWLEWYPQFYKAMNPNLPKFNGIDNPYHLHDLKK
jgi:hypothetical protein